MEYNKKMLTLGSKRSVIREIFEYSKQRSAEIGRDRVFDFSLGNPSVPVPKQVTDTLCELLQQENPILLHGYTSAQGDRKVRQVIADSIRRRFSVKNITPDHIYMTCGAAASLSICLKALITPEQNEECIVFAPFFTEYRVFAENAGGRLIISDPVADTFDLDLSDLRQKLSPNTRAVIINSPNNPSGVVYSEQTICGLCQLLREKSEEYGRDIVLIADEPYRELVYSDVTVPYLMNHYANTLVCYSYSKALSLPGERIGYIAVCPDMTDAEQIYLAICGAGRSLGYVCAPSLFQQLIARCEGCTVDIEIYRKNRDILYDSLTAYGYHCVKPDGAFYLFVKALEEDAYRFYERAKAHELLVVPCDDFGVHGYVRIAYCVDEDRVRRALPAFRALAEEYGK